MAVNTVRNGIQHGIFVHNAALQRRHHHHWFDRRTRFKHVGDGAVTHDVFRRTGEIIRVIGGAVRHRQHFASADIDQDRTPRFRFVKRHGIIQFAVNQRLQAFIDTQRQIVRGLAVGRGDIFNNAAIAVFTHDTFAGLAGQPFIKALLDPFNPLAIHVREANEVSGNFT